MPEWDITDPDALWKKLDAMRPEVVINAAAYTAVDRAEKEEKQAMRVNAVGPRHVAEWVSTHPAYLIHLSTDYVFDGEKPAGEYYSEQDSASPKTAYGRSKRAGELAVLETAPRAAVVRTAWMYGRQGGNFLKSILRRVVHTPEERVRIVNDQWGCPTWSHRLAEQMAAIIEHRMSGLIHAVSTGATTWFDFAKTFFEYMDVQVNMEPCPTAEYPTPAVRPANSALKNDRLEQAGLCMMRPWQDDLMQFVEQHGKELVQEAGGRAP